MMAGARCPCHSAAARPALLSLLWGADSTHSGPLTHHYTSGPRSGLSAEISALRPWGHRRWGPLSPRLISPCSRRGTWQWALAASAKAVLKREGTDGLPQQGDLGPRQTRCPSTHSCRAVAEPPVSRPQKSKSLGCRVSLRGPGGLEQGCFLSELEGAQRRLGTGKGREFGCPSFEHQCLSSAHPLEPLSY